MSADDGEQIFTDAIEIWRNDEWISVPFGTLKKGDRFRHTGSAAIPPHIVLICEADAISDRASVFGYKIICHRESG